MRKFRNKVLVRLFQKFQEWFASVSTEYMETQFKRCGKRTVIEQPFTVHMPSRISIGDGFTARANLKLRAYTDFNGKAYDPEIVIGDDVYVATDCHIAAIGSIRLGNHVCFASFVTVIDHMHGRADFSDIEVPVMQRELTTKGPIVIQDNVWIGEHSVILSGVTIGRNSVIGANSVVTTSIPENCIAAGSPARVIKQIL